MTQNEIKKCIGYFKKVDGRFSVIFWLYRKDYKKKQKQ